MGINRIADQEDQHTVIGLNYSPEDRYALWRGMVEYRGTGKAFSKSTDDHEKRIGERDMAKYRNHLEMYLHS